MTSLPQVREHINAADFQTVATFLPPAGEGRTLAVSGNEKAVVLRHGRVVDMFSGGSKPVQKEDEIVVASLRKYQIIIGFGDCSASHYNFSPTRIHVSRPAFPIADGEEIRSMIVAVSFALDRDDRANVEKLMTVGMANAGAITVANLAASLTALPHFVQSLIVSEPFDGPSIRANPERIAEIELQIQSAADGMLRRYGALSDGAALNVIATSRDAELAMPEKEREANAEHLLTLANLHRESARLERQVEPMKRLLETERIAHQTEKIRTEIMQERLEQSRIHAEIERIDPRMGATIPAPGVPPSVPLNNPVAVAPTPEPDATPDFATEDSAAAGYAPQADSPPTPSLSSIRLNMDPFGITLHKSACVHAENSDDKPNWKRFSSAEDAQNSTNLAIRECRDCHPLPGDDKIGAVSIYKAAQEGFTQKALGLISVGVDVNRKDPQGNTPFQYAVRDHHPEIAQALIAAGADIHAEGPYGQTLLHYAAGGGHRAAVDAQIAAGADIHAKDEDGETPLHYAARYGQTATIDALIAAGADIHAKDNGDTTPLHYAASGGQTATIDALIAAGADVNVKNVNGLTPLHNAADKGHRAAVDALIAAGADVNAKNNSGRTPLHDAASGGHRAAVDALIAAGADVNAKNDRGNTPLDIATLLHKTAAADALRAAGAQGSRS